MSYVDAIIHVLEVPPVLAWFAANDPDRINEAEDRVIGLARTPMTTDSVAALIYVRLTPEQETAYEGNLPGITVLAKAIYEGPSTPDAVFAAVFDDPAAKAKYDAAYPRTPYDVDDGEGGTITITPPERFGVMG